MNTAVCPSRKTLLAYAHATLSGKEAGRVAKHLEECSSCERVLEKLEQGSDSLLDGLREASGLREPEEGGATLGVSDASHDTARRSPPPAGALDASREARELDRVVDNFEAGWKGGERPAIEDFLEAPGVDHRELVFHLVGVEVFHRRKRGEAAGLEDYLQRYPELRDLGDRLQELVPDATSPRRPEPRRWPRPEPPERIGRFELEEVLGEGGFGTVYRAFDPRLDRQVALKIPRAGTLENPSDVERFLREARAAAGLRHANICPVYEVGEEENGQH